MWNWGISELRIAEARNKGQNALPTIGGLAQAGDSATDNEVENES